MHMSFTLRHRMLRSTARLADALLPGPCILCGDDATDTGWCAPCWSDIPGRGDARCPVCALPRPGEGTCGRCLSRPPQFTATFAAAGYGFPLDAIVSHFKYGRNLTLAAPLGRFDSAQVLDPQRDLDHDASLRLLHRRAGISCMPAQARLFAST